MIVPERFLERNRVYGGVFALLVHRRRGIERSHWARQERSTTVRTPEFPRTACPALAARM
jgi:hypothetical protein